MSTGQDDDTQRLGPLLLPLPGYTDLLGVPASTLERLRSLRADAEALRIPLAVWRDEHEAMRAGAHLPSDEQLESLRDEVTARLLALLVPRTNAERAEGDHLRRMLDDLALLEGPPTLDDVRRRLDELPDTRSWAKQQPRHWRDETLDRLVRHERYLRDWLRELDPDADAGPVDDVTGLPRQLVDRQLHRDDPVLGRVPVSVEEARARAYLSATEEERREATFWREALGVTDDETSWTSRLAEAELRRGILVDFLRFAHQHDSSTGEAMRQLWADAELPDLLEDFLNR